MIASLKSGFLPLKVGEREGKHLEIYGKLDGSEFCRLYKFHSFGYMEKWNLDQPKPEITHRNFVEITEDNKIPREAKYVPQFIKELLFAQIQGRSFIDKLKKRLSMAIGGSTLIV